MKLDRNDPKGESKYALVNMRKLRALDDKKTRAEARELVNRLHEIGVLELGAIGAIDEHFAIKLRDKYARDALRAYAFAAINDGNGEYGREVMELANRSGPMNPNCKRPD